MTDVFQPPTSVASDASSALVNALRRTLQAAQADLEIRRRVKALLADPTRFANLVRQLGPTHAVLRDLRALVGHGESEASEPSET